MLNGIKLEVYYHPESQAFKEGLHCVTKTTQTE